MPASVNKSKATLKKRIDIVTYLINLAHRHRTDRRIQWNIYVPLPNRVEGNLAQP
jgi:hypothetical protein